MRGTRLLKAAIVAATVSVIAISMTVPTAAHARPHTAACVGTTTLGPPVNYTSTAGRGVTVARWDFTGVQDLCLADGSVVVATMAGHLTLMTREDGTGRVVVRYSLAVPNGSLEGTVHTQFSPTSFDAKVHAFGGRGVLTGMSGYGTTVMTGPNTFNDTMVYRYR